MNVNAFSILDQEMNSVATGIYLGVSVTDHSCKPNAVATFDGTTLFIHTIEDLPSIDWSKIFISYVDPMDPIETRRHELSKNYYFLCECARCLGNHRQKHSINILRNESLRTFSDQREPLEMSSASCPNKNCAEMIFFAENTKLPSECEKCKQTITAKHRDTYTEVMDLTKLHLDQMKMSRVACNCVRCKAFTF